MKSLCISFFLAFSFVAGIIPSLTAQVPEKIYQEGLVKEEGEGALPEAIRLFSQVADNSKADKLLQAKALLHIGMCYEKLGKQEAVKAYQRLVTHFPEQKNEVTIARERLSKLMAGESPKEITIKQIGTKYDYTTSVSADGVYLAQAEWGTGNVELKNLKTGETKLVTNDATWLDSIQYVEYTLISPSGKQIAYQWYNSNGNFELRLLKLDTPVPVVLYTGKKDDYITPELWFPDEGKIVFQNYNGKDRIWQLLSVNTSNREVQLLKENPPGPAVNAHLSLSPDNKYLAFDFPNLSDQRKYDINLLSLEQKDESPFIKHPANDRLLGWLPGRNIFLFSSDRSGTTDILAVNTSDVKKIDVPKRILTNIGDIEPISFTKDGSLFCGVSANISELFITSLNIENGQISLDTKTPISGKYMDISWLPDGESLLGTIFVTEPNKSEKLKLCIINSKTGMTTTLADELTVVLPLRISPDGKSFIVFARDSKRSGETEYTGGMYKVDVKTGQAEEIKVNQKIAPIHCSYEWSKDGSGIFYTANNQILSHNIGTGEEKVIYDRQPFTFPNLKRSPDGNHLFADLMIDANGSICQLLSIPLNVGESKQMFTHRDVSNVRLKHMELSPDGKFLYFSSLMKGFRCVIYRIPVSGGTPEIRWQSKDCFPSGMSIHPEGNKIAISTWQPGGEMRLIENLGDKTSGIFSKNE